MLHASAAHAQDLGHKLPGLIGLDAGKAPEPGVYLVQLNHRKRGVDITRGDIVQVQGGMGVSVINRRLDIGIVGYALCQVTDDRGSDVPPALRGAREEAYGLGPEIVLSLSPFPARTRLRYERDVAVTSRPKGEIFLFGVEFAAWRPKPAGPPAPPSAR